jgi:hypothetical protein
VRYALVDNSTLTAAQRLLGHIEVDNLYQIDGDILAFEGLLQAMLFYDGIYCIDDYKSEHRLGRQKLFTFVSFLNPKDFNYEKLLRSAQKSTDSVMLRVQNGEVADEDFRHFFDMLQTHLMFTWDEHDGSNVFLRIRMLEGESGLTIDKYSALHEMITSQGYARGSSLEPPKSRFFRRKSRPERHWDKRVVDDVSLFASSLNWISLRTAFYILVAGSTGMEAVLHPIRHAFHLHLAEKFLSIPQSVVEPIVKMVRDGTEAAIRAITSVSDPVIFQKQIPIFSAYLASRNVPPQAFIDEALHLREEGPFVEARKQLNGLEEIVADHNLGSFVREVNRIQQSVKRTSERLLSEYAVTTPQGVPVSPVLSILNVPLKAKTGLSIPDFGWKLPLPTGLTRLADAYGFKAVFRSVATDLVSIERLGKLYERIGSAVARSEYASRRKIESYKDRSSQETDASVF